LRTALNSEWRPIFGSYNRWRISVNMSDLTDWAYLGAWVLVDCGFMNAIIFALRALSVSSSSGSKAAAFLFNDTGTVGVDTLSTWLAMRVRCGSGSRQSGGDIAS
jgi:hypothetical protein